MRRDIMRPMTVLAEYIGVGEPAIFADRRYTLTPPYALGFEATDALTPAEAPLQDRVTTHLNGIASLLAIEAIAQARHTIDPRQLRELTLSADRLYQPIPGPYADPIVGAVHDRIHDLGTFTVSEMDILRDAAALAALTAVMRRFTARYPLAETATRTGSREAVHVACSSIDNLWVGTAYRPRDLTSIGFEISQQQTSTFLGSQVRLHAESTDDHIPSEYVAVTAETSLARNETSLNLMHRIQGVDEEGPRMQPRTFGANLLRELGGALYRVTQIED